MTRMKMWIAWFQVKTPYGCGFSKFTFLLCIHVCIEFHTTLARNTEHGSRDLASGIWDLGLAQSPAGNLVSTLVAIGGSCPLPYVLDSSYFFKCSNTSSNSGTSP